MIFHPFSALRCVLETSNIIYTIQGLEVVWYTGYAVFPGRDAHLMYIQQDLNIWPQCCNLVMAKLLGVHFLLLIGMWTLLEIIMQHVGSWRDLSLLHVSVGWLLWMVTWYWIVVVVMSLFFGVYLTWVACLHDNCIRWLIVSSLIPSFLFIVPSSTILLSFTTHNFFLFRSILQLSLYRWPK